MKHKQIFRRRSTLAFLVSTSLSTSALATNGYAPHGVGMLAKGMGGVSLAEPQDAVALGMNPAGSAWMDNRLDAGIDLFSPDRGSSIEGNSELGVTMSFDGNDTGIFPVPEFGYKRSFNDKIAYALTLFGNGGMNTDYGNGIPLFNGGTRASTGINLMQMFIVPSVSYKLNDRHAFGIGLNMAMQGFEAEGLQSFDHEMFSSSPGSVTNNGMDWSNGLGLRLGWTGRLTDQVTLAATYQTRTAMSEFDDYKGLFAEQGDFDIPSNLGFGVSFRANDQFRIAADILQINFSEVEAVGNSAAIQMPLGADGGKGFGWDDMTVFKIGAEYQVTPKWIVRGGFNHGSAPIPSNETLFNMLAPATVETHITVGASWNIRQNLTLNGAFMYAPESEIKGQQSIDPGFGGGNANIRMSQTSLGLSLSWLMN